MNGKLPKISRIGLLAAALALAAGCAGPSALSSAAQLAQGRSVHLTSKLSRTPKPVLGVSLYAIDNYAARVVAKDGARDLSYIRNTLRASSVAISWNFYTKSDKSNVVSATKNTLSTANVQALTLLARKDHLSVEYRPLIKVQQGAPWDGYDSPANQARWFASFYRAELPYLRLAKRLHVGEFVVSTELVELNASKQWPAFISRVRRVYPGIVSYAAYSPQYVPAHRHLLPVRLLGVTGYPPFNLPNSASVSRLVKAWLAFFKPVPVAIIRRTAIDEIGIPAIDGAYHHPAEWSAKGRLNEVVQARFFASACIAVKDLRMRGIYFWNANLTANPQFPPYPSPTTFEGKKGAKAIAGCAKTFG